MIQRLMNGFPPRRDVLRERLANSAALVALLAIGALALVGPAGVLAWGEDAARLSQHEVRLAQLREEAVVLENRKDLLDPSQVDPDLASELVRGKLNVAHPDEYVVELGNKP